MKNKPAKTVSRRARPAKAPLSVEAIVDAALEIMAREGLYSLGMRKIAAALDTGPASLYVYVDNFDSLRSLILDRALAKVTVPAPSRGDWRERLSIVLLSYMKVLMSMRGLGQLALTVISVGPGSMRLLEAVLALLREGGVEDDRATWAVDTLLLQFAALAAEQDAHSYLARPPELGSVRQALEALSPETYPNLHALRKKLLEGTPRVRVRWTLNVLINGVLNTPRAKSE
ncbi:MAG: TetR/AcrR family transcriptional regulator [Opitutaceae bacterium]|nr:TetR/AcrR family transcriptional regulator [Opitutaceae bacterium]